MNTTFSLKNDKPIAAKGEATPHGLSKGVIDRALKMFNPRVSTALETSAVYTDAMFLNDLKRANAKLDTNPADPQTGKPIKFAVSEKGMAKFLKELEEE
jgi:hypothetical protein